MLMESIIPAAVGVAVVGTLGAVAITETGKTLRAISNDTANCCKNRRQNTYKSALRKQGNRYSSSAERMLYG